MAGPSVIGLVAEATSLRVALGLAAALAAMLLTLAKAVTLTDEHVAELVD